MTRQSLSDIDAILGEEPEGDKDHRAQLVARLSAMLESAQSLPTGDVMQLAAYLDQGLTQEERLALYNKFATSAAARAELDSAVLLLETVENSQSRPSPALVSRAREIAMEQHVSEPRKSIWQRLRAPRSRVGLGFAFAALAVLAIWIPEMSAVNTGRMTEANRSGSADGGPRSAFENRAASRSPASPVPAPQLWGAVAVSGAGNIFGIAQNAPTRENATMTAVLDCIARHGANCVVAASAQGQCFAVVGRGIGAPVAKVADTIEEAQRRALAACHEELKAGSSCTIASTFCSEK